MNFNLKITEYIDKMAENGNAMWTVNDFTGIKIRIRKSDGYMHAGDICKINKKKTWSDYFRLNKTQEFIEALEKRTKLEVAQSTTSNTMFKGTWIHPEVATHLALWVSPIFAADITLWIEEWKKYSADNLALYLKKLSTLKPSQNAQKERAIQAELQKQYNGSIEVETTLGYIDLMYRENDIDYIVEIKVFSKWKAALGQILSYGSDYPSHVKVIYLFGNIKSDMVDKIRKIYGAYNVELRLQ